MSKLTEVNLVENIIKKNSFLNCSQLWMWMKGAIRNKEAMNTMDTERWHLLHMWPINCANRQLWSFFHLCCNMLFIHSFICTFSDFPINCKGVFFVFRSISNTVNVNKPLSIFCIYSRSAIWEEENDVNGEIMLGNTPRNVIPRYTRNIWVYMYTSFAL